MAKSKNNKLAAHEHTQRNVLKQFDTEIQKNSKHWDDDLNKAGLHKYMALFVFVTTFIIYLKTAHPSLPGGDSGEIIVAANELGVAHPPGYPLFTLLAKLFIIVIPAGSVAWRVNCLSVVCGAAASTFIFLTVHRMTSSLDAGLLSAGIFAFSRLTWTWSVSAEVFALNNLLISALLLIAATFDRCDNKDSSKICLLGSFFCGLCLTNQHTSVLFIAVIVPWVFYCRWINKDLTLGLVLRCSMYFLAGLLPYIYLPISSLANAARWTWGDQSTIRGFLTHLLRQEYGTLDLLKDHTGQGFFAGLLANIEHMWIDLTPFVCLLLLISLGTSFIKWRQCQPVGFLIICYVMLLLYLTFFCWRANLDINNPLFFRVVERFWIQSDLLVCILAAVAFDDVLRLITEYVDTRLKWSGTALAVFIVAYQLNQWWVPCNHSNNYVIHDFARQTLASFPNGSIVLTKGDLPSNSLRYFHLCEGVRPDVTVFDQEVFSYEWSLPMTRKFYPSLNFPGDRWQPHSKRTKDGLQAFTFKDFIAANYREHPIFVCIGVQDHESSWKSTYILQPFGVCSRLVSSQETLHIEKLANTSQDFGRDWKHEFSSVDDGSWEYVATAEMWRGRTAMALYFLELGLQHPSDSVEAKALLLKSYELYNTEIKKHQVIPAYWHRNFGIVCEHLSRQIPSQQRQLLSLTLHHFQQAATLDPLDPDKDKLLKTVDTLQNFLQSNDNS